MTQLSPLLEMRQIRKSFSGTEVLHGVDLSLHSGEVLALLGENGAGKSTLMKILNGDYSKDAGQILIDGLHADFRSPRDAQRAGIQVIYQELNDAPDLSATENVLLGHLPRKAGLLVNWPEAHQRASRVLASLNADFPPDRPMRRLSVGQRQIVEIAKALSATTPVRILVMDEPTAALTPREVDVLFETIASLRREGVGIIYISHRLDEVQRVAQRVMVLRDGHVAGVVPANQISRRDIVRMMVGRELPTLSDAPLAPSRTPPVGATPASRSPLSPSPGTPGEGRGEGLHSSHPAALQVQNLTRAGAFHDVSFSLHPGETLGLFGLLGAGHFELTRTLFGIDPYDSGSVLITPPNAHALSRDRTERSDAPPPAPVPLPSHSIRAAIASGIGLVSEDRKTEALIPAMSVADNLMLAHWPAVSTTGIVSRDRQFAKTQNWIQRLDVRLKSGPRQPIATLSGGNQQKVILARWLEAGVRVLLLNEPTRGVDVGARADIYALLAKLRQQGLAVIVCSSDLEEVLEVSDRILVFAKGRLVESFNKQSANQVSLLAAAAGT